MFSLVVGQGKPGRSAVVKTEETTPRPNNPKYNHKYGLILLDAPARVCV